ncbi:uncharacterized protein LOC131161484 [Malania oleifera]|uniref:uncharacterized protein LOC131161484 n=1 Tax=Malania oleifera TaxID=397392 RepID=UPI0025AEB09B|nr:uncharacterized protein LOC131161484 [Malania oleifera]
MAGDVARGHHRPLPAITISPQQLHVRPPSSPTVPAAPATLPSGGHLHLHPSPLCNSSVATSFGVTQHQPRPPASWPSSSNDHNSIKPRHQPPVASPAAPTTPTAANHQKPEHSPLCFLFIC